MVAIGIYAANAWPFAHQPLQPDSSQTDGAKTQEQQNSNNQSKEVLIESSAGNKDNSITDTAGGDDTNSQKSIIMTTEQNDNGTLTVFTKLYGYSDGVCTLTIYNGHSSSQTANVIFQPEYSTCAGFSVNIAEIGPGPWTMSLSVNSGGQSTTKQISVEIK